MRRLGILLISGLFAICSAWVVFDTLFFPRAARGESVEIPNFCGMDADAIDPPKWADVHFEYRYDGETEEGVVLLQEPRAGVFRRLTDAAPKCNLTLTVSLGAESAVLPSLYGEAVREAQSALRALGLAVTCRELPSAYPQGTVIAMQPEAGARVPLGSEVVLTVSEERAAESVTVPSVVGLSRSEALVRLWAAQLAVDEVCEEFSIDAPDGTVLRQSLQAGTLVPSGAKITLYIANSYAFEQGENE